MMESLDDTSWDVVISGTGFPQSLLALALSRSGKKVLHIDRNDYYGGDEAALSLSEAGDWAKKHADIWRDGILTFSHASIVEPAHEPDSGKLLSPRAYSLALAPQLLYARSTLIPALVSSHTHNQLEFQAVGSWFLLKESEESKDSPGVLTRVPGGREDVFQDTSLDLKAKRSLMKFLRFVASHEEQGDTWQEDKHQPLPDFLSQKFAIPPNLHPPILALSLSPHSPASTTTEYAIPRIARHLTSIGVFGPGFSAVLPKWGGLSEIGQVACRASAVGGGVYVLGRGLTGISRTDDACCSLQLSDGSKVTSTWVVGCAQELPSSDLAEHKSGAETVGCFSISIVSSPLSALFPSTSEGGVAPAGAVVILPPSSDEQPPVYILIHSSESGECPSGQCVVYASTVQDHERGFEVLESAVGRLLLSSSEQTSPSVLWRMQYLRHLSQDESIETDEQVLTLPSLSLDLALDDAVLENVKHAWQKLTGNAADSFLQFDARDGTLDDDDDQQ